MHHFALELLDLAMGVLQLALGLGEPLVRLVELCAELTAALKSTLCLLDSLGQDLLLDQHNGESTLCVLDALRLVGFRALGSVFSFDQASLQVGNDAFHALLHLGHALSPAFLVSRTFCSLRLESFFGLRLV